MRPDQIRAARAALRWSQAELAQRAGVHTKSVGYWESRDGSESTVGAMPKISGQSRLAQAAEGIGEPLAEELR
ncbi:helix-turn-helix transcriptional regulator [Tropicimonas sp. IMCC6043]|uniref:helix-turn-helix transcriptional regulator n=1 Tax=Tropicimonas sp. IMCC6043 TaxID=2510645 RepID=UPI001F5DE36C|nr:helix-turn-helix transcriptional regulator [Tropicimonas sp. IMCC6043]